LKKTPRGGEKTSYRKGTQKSTRPGEKSGPNFRLRGPGLQGFSQGGLFAEQTQLLGGVNREDPFMGTSEPRRGQNLEAFFLAKNLSAGGGPVCSAGFTVNSKLVSPGAIGSVVQGSAGTLQNPG